MLKTDLTMKQASEVLKLLAHETRLTMLKILSDHDCCVCEFVEIFNASQPAISQHLRRLRDHDLILEEKRGQWTFYSLNKSHPYYEFLTDVLDHLPDQQEKLQQLEENGTRIQCNS